MNSQSINILMGGVFTKEALFPPTPKSKEVVHKKMEKLAVNNDTAFDRSFKERPEYLRTPTADELVEMRQWAIDYRKANKGGSKRQVRKATQEHFKIRIFR